MIRSFIGYAVLAGITSVLFFLALVKPLSALGFHAVSFAGIIVLGVLLLEEVRLFIPDVFKPGEAGVWEREDAYNFLSVVIGALITFFLSVNVGLGPVVASSSVGIAVAFLKPSYGPAVYCGSFVGMACAATFSYGHLSFAAVVAGLVYVLSKYVFDGFGGKLGTIAFSGCVIASLALGRSLTSDPVPGWEVGRYLILVSVIAAVATFMLSVRLKLNVVFSSGIVGLAAGVALPLIAEEGSMLAVMAFCASFAGMSARERVSNEAYMAVAGLVSAFVFIFGSPYLGGAGGKLGTIAFGSAIFVFALTRGINYAAGKVRRGEYPVLPSATQRDRCNLCGECVEACPNGVLQMLERRIVADPSKDCAGCMACYDVCENGALAR